VLYQNAEDKKFDMTYYITRSSAASANGVLEGPGATDAILSGTN